MATNGRNLPAELEAWRLANDKTFDELADAIAAITGRRRNSDCWRRVCLGQTKHPHERTLDMLTTFLDAAAAGEHEEAQGAPESFMTQWVVTLAQIRMDEQTQVRAAIDLAVVAEYGEQMAAGVVFPPITVFNDEGTLYLADGFHRVRAAQRCGQVTFPADVYPGTQRDALWYALGANRTHGQPLTKGDKSHAVRLALKMWPTRSNREIAHQVGCSRSLVSTAARQDSAKNKSGQSAILPHGRTLRNQQKRAAVREMVLAGQSTIDIQHSLHAHAGLVADVRRNIRRANGEVVVDYSRRGAAARRVQLQEMAKAGHSTEQMAAALGLHVRTIRSIVKRDSIAVPADLVTHHTRRLNATRIMSRIVADADDLSAGANLIDFKALDTALFSDWLTSLRHARSTLGMFIRRILQEQSHGKDDVPPHRVQIRPVPISQMRIPTPLVTQREFRKAHGDAIAADLDLNKLGYPIVNHRDGMYWVLDGQHRIYALKQNGFGEDVLDCEVYEHLTDAQAADIFLGRDKRRQVAPFDKFLIACTAGYTRETSIRRAVESNGQKVSRDRDEGISTVGAIGKVYDQSGDVVLGQVIRTINLSFAGDPLGFDRSVIEGLGLVYNRFNGRTNEKAMAQRLGGLKQGARELLRKAEALRERTGNQKKHCVAAVVVDTYNKGEGAGMKNRLPSWWKEIGPTAPSPS